MFQLSHTRSSGIGTARERGSRLLDTTSTSEPGKARAACGSTRYILVDAQDPTRYDTVMATITRVFRALLAACASLLVACHHPVVQPPATPSHRPCCVRVSPVKLARIRNTLATANAPGQLALPEALGHQIGQEHGSVHGREMRRNAPTKSARLSADRPQRRFSVEVRAERCRAGATKRCAQNREGSDTVT